MCLAREGDAPVTPFASPARSCKDGVAHRDVPPLCPGATHLLSSSYLDLERERWGGMEELVRNRLLSRAPSTPPSSCSKPCFQPLTWQKQGWGRIKEQSQG